MFRSLQHTIIAVYLLVTLSAFTYTMTRHVLPGIPVSLTLWSYGMMAPYQTDASWNGDVYVEGQFADGSWEEVSLDRYLPHGFGEKNVRKLLSAYGDVGDEARTPFFKKYLSQVLEREQKRGKLYVSLRMYEDTWDRSNGGYAFLRQPLFMTRTFITQIP